MTSPTQTLHVSWTRFSIIKQPVMECWTCKVRRRFLAQFQDYYGWRLTCLSCGDCWADGERQPRPTRRGWRKEQVAYAKARWAEYKVQRTA